MIRILYVIPTLGYGGAEKLLVNLLREFENTDIEAKVVILTKNTSLKEALPSTVECINIGPATTIYNIGRNIGLVCKISRIIRQFNPNIIHTHLYMADLLLRFAWLTSRSVLVSTVHATDKWWYENGLRSFIKTKLDSISARLSGSHFICVSELVAVEANRILKIPRGKLNVINNGIVLKQLSELPLRTKGYNIIQVGRFFPEKNHILSISAFEIVRTYFPESSLTFVGDGPLRNQLQAEVCRRGLAGSIRFLGEVPDVLPYFRAANIYWMPSLYEGLSLACLEAMASALPIVVSDVGGLRPLVERSSGGMLVSPLSDNELAKVTIELLSDHDQCTKLGANARKYALNFDIRQTANSYISLYHKLLVDMSA